MKKYLKYISLIILITVVNSCGRLYCDVIQSGPSKYCDNFYRRENEKAIIKSGIREGRYTRKSEEEIRREGRENDELLRRLRENRERQNQNK